MNKKKMLLSLIDHYSNGNKAKFARMLDISPQSLHTWLSRSTFDTEVLFTKCKGISAKWLLSGEGDMIVAPSNPDDIPFVDLNEQNEYNANMSDQPKMKPRVPFSAAAGALSGIADSAAFADCEMFPEIEAFKSYDFTMIIHGDSMIPEFLSGDEVACKIVDDVNLIKWGHPHILDTMDGAALKKIYDNGKEIICRSINHDEYPDYVVPKKDIIKVALVVGTIRRY